MPEVTNTKIWYPSGYPGSAYDLSMVQDYWQDPNDANFVFVQMVYTGPETRLRFPKAEFETAYQNFLDNEPTPGPPGGLAHAWLLQEGSGTVIGDSEGSLDLALNQSIAAWNGVGSIGNRDSGVTMNVAATGDEFRVDDEFTVSGKMYFISGGTMFWFQLGNDINQQWQVGYDTAGSSFRVRRPGTSNLLGFFEPLGNVWKQTWIWALRIGTSEQSVLNIFKFGSVTPDYTFNIDRTDMQLSGVVGDIPLALYSGGSGTDNRFYQYGTRFWWGQQTFQDVYDTWYPA